MSEILGDLRNFDFKIREVTDAAMLKNKAIAILTNTLQNKQDSLQEQEQALLDNIKLFEKSVAIVNQSLHEIALLKMPPVTTEVINSLFNNKTAVKEYLNGSQNTEEAQHRLKTLVLKETSVIQQYYNVNSRPKPNPNPPHKLTMDAPQRQQVLNKNELTKSKELPNNDQSKQSKELPNNDQSRQTISVSTRNLTLQVRSPSSVPITPHSENTIELD